MLPAALCRSLRLPRFARCAACCGAIGLALVFAPTARSMAQAPGAPAVPAPPAGATVPGGAAPAPVPAATRPLFMEWVIVAAMVGLSLFVVCKSSRRN